MKRILIVDDDKDYQKLVKLSVNETETLIDQAYDYEQAVRMVVKNSYDLALVDFVLDGKDGIDVAFKLNQLKPDLPIYLLTNYAELLDNLPEGSHPRVNGIISKIELSGKIPELLGTL